MSRGECWLPESRKARAFLVLTEIAKPPAPPAQPPIKGTLGAVGPGERVAWRFSVKTRNDLVQIRNLLTIGAVHALGERGFDELIDIPIQNRRRV